MKVFHFSEFNPKGRVNKLQQVVVFIPGFRKLSRNVRSSSLFLHRLPQPPDGFSWCFSALALGFRIFFFFAHPGQLSPGVSRSSLRSHYRTQNLPPLVQAVFLVISFEVEVLAIFETPSISLGYITYFFLLTQTLWLWPGCGWTNISPPKTVCKLENEIWHEILRTEPWPASHYPLSILRSTMLFPTQLCLVNLQLSFSIFFPWWQCLRCDRCWSEKNQSSYLSVTRVPRHPSFRR